MELDAGRFDTRVLLADRPGPGRAALATLVAPLLLTEPTAFSPRDW